MTNNVVIRVRDLRTYLDAFPDDAVVLRDVSDATLEGAYVDLNVAMRHLEQEHGTDRAIDVDDDENEEFDPEGDNYDPEAEIQEARDLTRDQERSIAAWEKAQG